MARYFKFFHSPDVEERSVRKSKGQQALEDVLSKEIAQDREKPRVIRGMSGGASGYAMPAGIIRLPKK
ncbi:MAG: hypothetical protein KDI46_06725 [Alphaproteobacteria bacterium]|nr:hypothetical protein [Alphaproteobacteria bacterium]